MRIAAIIIFTTLILACSKKQKNTAPAKCEAQCTSWLVYPYFTGFTDEECDTVIVKKYETGSGFTKMTEQELITHPFTKSPRGIDTFKGAGYAMATGADYEITVPGTGKTYRIVLEEQQLSQSTDCARPQHCYNNVLTSKINDNTIQLSPFNEGWMDIRLNK